MILQAILRAHRAKGKDESLWGVALVEVVESDDGLRPGQEIVAKGDLVRAAAVGETLRLDAELVQDPKWGRQLQINRQESLGISRESDAHRWLERLDGVGPVMARRIHDHFGGRVLEVLRAAPGDGAEPLCEVEGIGPVLAQTIRESWGQIGAQGDPETLAFLDGLGLTRWEVNGVLAAARKHGEPPRAFLETNPYRLIESKGFGFKRADNVALRAGVHREAPARLDAAVVFRVEEICAQDTTVPVGRLVAGVLEETGVKDKLALDAIYRVARSGAGIVLSREADVELVHPRKLLDAERTIYQWATGAAGKEPEGAPAGPQAAKAEAPADEGPASDPPTVVIEPEPVDFGESEVAPMSQAAAAKLAEEIVERFPEASAPPLTQCNCEAGWGPRDDHAPWCGPDTRPERSTEVALGAPAPAPRLSPEELAARAERHAVACELFEMPNFVPAGGECFACGANVYALADGSTPIGGCPACGKNFTE